MSDYYSYDLWNGKKVVGQYNSYAEIKLTGNSITIPVYDNSKYVDRYEAITVPILYKLTKTDYKTSTVLICLDVSRKSKRQIKLLKKCIEISPMGATQ